MLPCFALALMCLVPGQGRTSSTDGERTIPPAVSGVLGFFPDDTETIVVARAFKLRVPARDDPGDQAVKRWASVKELSLGTLRSLEAAAALNQLDDRDIAIAFNAGRSFETVSSFGSLRYEGCSIIRLSEALPNGGQEFTEALRGNSTDVRQIADTEVFVFPDRTVMESTFKQKPWQGQYITLPAPDTVVCATSDVFLCKVLELMALEPRRNCALMQTSEWAYVDPSAPAFLLRHIPDSSPGQRITGLTWCLNPDGRDIFEVRYSPSEGADARPLAEMWNKSERTPPASIARKHDGSVVIAIADVGERKMAIWHAMMVYRTMGETGLLPPFGATKKSR